MDERRVVEEIDAVKYIEQYVSLDSESNDDELFGLCPFHAEHTPSFSVTASNGKWYCFGCHRGGDIITFAMKYHHLTRQEAVESLIKYGHIQEGYQSIHAAQVMKRYKPSARNTKRKTYKIYDSNIMDTFSKAPEILDVWRIEGIRDEEIEKYQVRYDQTWNRIVFPIRNVSGDIINISGRTLEPHWETKRINGKPMRKYCYYSSLGVLDTLYGLWENKHNIQSKKEVIVFEGAKSVMKAEGWGFVNCVAALTNRINPYQLRLFLMLGCRVVVAFDEGVDSANIDTTKKLARYLPVEVIENFDGLLGEKMSPVDAGKEVWEKLYERRRRIY